MPEIIDKKVNLEFPLGHHLHCMVAQLPNHLKRADIGFSLVDPEEKWRLVSSVPVSYTHLTLPTNREV